MADKKIGDEGAKALAKLLADLKTIHGFVLKQTMVQLDGLRQTSLNPLTKAIALKVLKYKMAHHPILVQCKHLYLTRAQVLLVVT